MVSYPFKSYYQFLLILILSVLGLHIKLSAQDHSHFLTKVELEQSGFNADSIRSLICQIRESPGKDFRGIVILKNNQIVVEEYFNTYWRMTVNDIRSAGKSITTLLLGIAIKEGLIESLDQDIYSLFDKHKNPRINEDYKKIKLKHLLDMASGLDANTDNVESIGHAIHWMALDDWKDFLLNVPVTGTPDEGFSYADIHPLLVGLAIEEATGMSLKDYANKKLFKPLGITQTYWYTNTANQTGAAGNLYLTTLDFAKLGLLVLKRGKWGDQQIIDEEFIDRLMNHKSEAIGDWFFAADAYGMFWYKSKRNFGNKKFDYLFASGSGGNHLIVFPKENMVIALTSTAYGPGPGQRISYEIMSKILAAFNKPE